MKRLYAALLPIFIAAAPMSALADEAVITVKGMVCSFCAQGIKKTFGKMDSVQSVEVDLDAKIVRLVFKKGASLDDKEIQSKINDAGYDVEKIERRNDE